MTDITLPDDERHAIRHVDILISEYEADLHNAVTQEDVHFQRIRNADLQTHIKQALPRVIKDRKQRFELEWRAGSLYLETSVLLGKMWHEESERARPGGNRINKHSENYQNGINWQDYGFTSPRDAVACERASLVDDDDRNEYYDQCRINSRQPTLHGLERVWHQFHKPQPVERQPDDEQETETDAWHTKIMRSYLSAIDLSFYNHVTIGVGDRTNEQVMELCYHAGITTVVDLRGSDIRAVCQSHNLNYVQLPDIHADMEAYAIMDAIEAHVVIEDNAGNQIERLAFLYESLNLDASAMAVYDALVVAGWALLDL